MEQQHDLQQIMHGLSDQSIVQSKEEIYQNTASFPRLSASKQAALLLPSRVKRVEVRPDRVLLHVAGRYVDEEYTYRYLDYRPVFVERPNTTNLAVRIAFGGEGTVRITANPGFATAPTQSHLLAPGGERFLPLTVRETEALVEVSGGGLRVRIGKDPWSLEIEDGDGAVFYRQFGRDNHSFMPYEVCPFGFYYDGDGGEVYACEAVHKSPYERIYGIGENFSALDRSGRAFDLWNTNSLGVNTHRAYKYIPYYISTDGYAAFYNTARKLRMDMGETLSKANAVMVQGEVLDYFVMRGGQVKELLPRYLELTGRSPLPPKWSFGVWMSKISYGTQQEVETVASRLREEQVPCDVIHIDTDWFPENWVCDWKFDRNKFPQPEQMVERLHGQGYHLSLWQLPYVERGNISTEVYDYGMQKGFFATLPDGGRGFPHGLIDFSNPEAADWYKQQLLGPLLKLGIDVIKVDFGESAPDFYRYAGAAGEEMHNLYALLYNQAAYEATREVRGEAESMIWARSAWAGSQRYPLHWGGDAGTDFGSLASSVKGCLSLGLSGFPFWSSDIGGFWFDSPPTLYVRWSQFGMFCSHARFHGFYTREPWDFGQEAFVIVRDYIRLRYRLLPYIYNQACQALEDGLPLQRALVIDYPGDPTVEQIDTQYLFGDSLLVCPVLREDSRVRLYLPQGVWTDFHSGQRLEGGKWLEFTAPLHQLPLYVRENAIIPMGPVMDYVGQKETDPLTLRLYPVSGRSSLRLREEQADVVMEVETSAISLSIQPVNHNLELVFYNTGGNVSLNGRPALADVQGNSLVLKVDREEAAKGCAVQVQC